ncbi:MAG: TRL-like family protein [Planctomycetota bacterium]
MRLALILCCGLALGATGCAGMYAAPVVPAPGMLYTNMKAPLDIDADGNPLGSKMGSAEVKSYLSAVTMGDASIQAAAANGGITKVHHVDYEAFSILGVYSRFKVIVHGE